MVRVELTRTIRRPIGEVFDRLGDIDRYPEWMPDRGLFRSCWKASDGPVDVGTAYVDRTRVGDVHGEVVEFARPTRLAFHYTARLLGRTVMEGWPAYTLEPAGNQVTRVFHHASGRLQGAFRVLEPLVQRLARAERRRTVDALQASFQRDRTDLPSR